MRKDRTEGERAKRAAREKERRGKGTSVGRGEK